MKSINKPFLSIIIPCYNIASYLPDTIHSLRALTNAEDCEFIFINDGSNDNTLAIIQDFAKEDHRAIVIDQKNAGVSASRNAALRIAKGDYFLPLDGDDQLIPEAIEIIKSEIKEADILMAQVQKVRPNRIYVQPLPIQKGTYSPYEFYQSCSIFPTSPKLVYKMDIIRKHSIFFNEDIHSGEIYVFTCHYMRFCHSITITDKTFYQYMIRQSSATNQPNFEKDLSVLTIIDRIFDYSDPSVINLRSFSVTIVRMCSSFVYNKYALAGLLSPQALDVIRQMFQHPTFDNCLKKTAFASCKWNKDRLRALYMLTTKIWGYKLLVHCYHISHPKRELFD